MMFFPATSAAQLRLYLDESGTLGFGDEVFTMAMVLVNDLAKLEGCIARSKTTQAEIKASQMKTAQKLALAKTILEHNDLEIYLLTIDPAAANACERKLDKELLYDSMIAQAMAYYLERDELPRGGAYRLSLDMRGGIRESFEDMVCESIGNVLMHREEPLVSDLQIRYMDSKYSAGVQVADLFSNIYRTALSLSDSPCNEFLRKGYADGIIHLGFSFGLPELANQMTQIANDLRAHVEYNAANNIASTFRMMPAGMEEVAGAFGSNGETQADKMVNAEALAADDAGQSMGADSAASSALALAMTDVEDTEVQNRAPETVAPAGSTATRNRRRKGAKADRVVTAQDLPQEKATLVASVEANSPANDTTETTGDDAEQPHALSRSARRRRSRAARKAADAKEATAGKAQAGGLTDAVQVNGSVDGLPADGAVTTVPADDSATATHMHLSTQSVEQVDTSVENAAQVDSAPERANSSDESTEKDALLTPAVSGASPVDQTDDKEASDSKTSPKSRRRSRKPKNQADAQSDTQTQVTKENVQKTTSLAETSAQEGRADFPATGSEVIPSDGKSTVDAPVSFSATPSTEPAAEPVVITARERRQKAAKKTAHGPAKSKQERSADDQKGDVTKDRTEAMPIDTASSDVPKRTDEPAPAAAHAPAIKPQNDIAADHQPAPVSDSAPTSKADTAPKPKRTRTRSRSKAKEAPAEVKVKASQDGEEKNGSSQPNEAHAALARADAAHVDFAQADALSKTDSSSATAAKPSPAKHTNKQVKATKIAASADSSSDDTASAKATPASHDGGADNPAPTKPRARRTRTRKAADSGTQAQPE